MSETLAQGQLAEVLRLHKLYREGAPDGRRADLRGANLRETDLCETDLRGANLREANLRRADLRRADLRRADLRGADLRGANLRETDLCETDLRGADLRGADLYGADLRGADLRGANLRGAAIPAVAAAQTEIIPREGEVVGWKKCRGGVLVKIRVPAGAKRSNATGRKCRAECAEVLEVKGGTFGVSLHDGRTEYRVGKSVVADGWGADRWAECAPGIHFFLTEEEAAAYEG